MHFLFEEKSLIFPIYFCLLKATGKRAQVRRAKGPEGDVLGGGASLRRSSKKQFAQPADSHIKKNCIFISRGPFLPACTFGLPSGRHVRHVGLVALVRVLNHVREGIQVQDKEVLQQVGGGERGVIFGWINMGWVGMKVLHDRLL